MIPFKFVIQVAQLLLLASPVLWSNIVIVQAATTGHGGDQCHPWSFYNETLRGCQCYNSPVIKYDHVPTDHHYILHCSQRRVLLNILCWMTTEENGTYYIGQHHYYSFNPSAIVDGLYVMLPDNASELNDFMCGPVNRKGRVCSECIDGFAPSVTSIGFQCSNCTTSTWYGVLLYSFLEFVPITVFYLVIYFFRVSLTSSPLTYCVMYSQLSNYGFTQKPVLTMLQSSHEITFLKILITFHGVWNLDFFRYIIPPFCVSPNLKFIHVFFLGYISALYPLLLIGLTWVSMQSYSCSIKPLTWLWNKVSCRRATKDSKTTITDIFATFFLLSYSKLCFISMMTLGRSYTINTQSQLDEYVRVDLRIRFLSKEHIPYVVIASIVGIVLGVLPALVLIIYPVRLLRSLFLLDRLGGHYNAVLNIFVEKFYCCYRDGLDGGRDRRSFASLHLICRLLGGLIGNWSMVGSAVFFGGCSLLILLVRPCKKAYMNNIDALILALTALIALQSHILFSEGYSSINIWSGFISSCLPLLVMYIYLIPCKYRVKLKEVTTLAIRSVRRILCCCFEGSRANPEIDPSSGSDVADPDRMVRPDQYPGGDKDISAEGDALLRNSKCLYTYTN